MMETANFQKEMVRIETIKKSRGLSFLATVIIYILAAVLGILLAVKINLSLWLDILIADVAATVFVFGFSLLFHNASVYDPYWSVQPVVIGVAYAVMNGVTRASLLLLGGVIIWGIRLTGNWIYTFHGYDVYEDWRYRMLREKSGKWYPFVNFFGIHMVPTLIVYACTMPLVEVLKAQPKGNVLYALFALICYATPTLQFVSDTLMHQFRKHPDGTFIRKGPWKYARHPNYLGEILMWWGVALSAMAVLGPQIRFMIGALANTVLFLTASIPMADKHQARKAGYEEYRAQTRSLLPIPKLRGMREKQENS